MMIENNLTNTYIEEQETTTRLIIIISYGRDIKRIFKRKFGTSQIKDNQILVLIKFGKK